MPRMLVHSRSLIKGHCLSPLSDAMARRLPYESAIGHESLNKIGRRVKMRKQKGFSLIELLIVVAIILIIAAIAIPNLLRARIAANEASAVSSIRTINTA